MGSRSSGSFSSWGGGGRGVGKVAQAVSGSVPASVVVGTAIGVLSATVPVVGTAVAAYTAGKMVVDAVSEGSKVYHRTGDTGRALGAAGVSLAGSAMGAIGGQAISTAATVGWCAAKSASGVKTSPIADKVITSAISATVQEGASRTWKRKRR